LEHTVAGNAAASGDCQGLALAEANTCKGVVAHFQARDLTQPERRLQPAAIS